MKLLTTIVATSLVTLSAGTYAQQAQKLVAADRSITTDICMAVATNKRVNLLVALRKGHLSLKTANKSVTCNGLNLAAFAEKYHATKTLAYLQRGKKNAGQYSSL